jgi:hypothetical protein
MAIFTTMKRLPVEVFPDSLKKIFSKFVQSAELIQTGIFGKRYEQTNGMFTFFKIAPKEIFLAQLFVPLGSNPLLDLSSHSGGIKH